MPSWRSVVWADTKRVSDGRRLWASGVQPKQNYTLGVALLSPAMLLRVEPFRYSGRYRGAHGLRVSRVAPVGRLLRRVRITKPWRTLFPLLFTEHLDNIGKCKGAADFPECGGKMRQAMGLYALEMLHLPGWALCPEPANEREVWKKANNNLFFRPFLHDRRISAHHRAGAREQ